jgi:hypothetical protein
LEAIRSINRIERREFYAIAANSPTLRRKLRYKKQKTLKRSAQGLHVWWAVLGSNQ